jgi:hypothetical protein
MEESDRSRWPRRLSYGFEATRLLGLRVRVPPLAWMSVSCECCVMSGRGLRVGLITSPEESSLYAIQCNNNLYTYSEFTYLRVESICEISLIVVHN